MKKTHIHLYRNQQVSFLRNRGDILTVSGRDFSFSRGIFQGHIIPQKMLPRWDCSSSRQTVFSSTFCTVSTQSIVSSHIPTVIRSQVHSLFPYLHSRVAGLNRVMLDKGTHQALLKGFSCLSLLIYFCMLPPKHLFLFFCCISLISWCQYQNLHLYL